MKKGLVAFKFIIVVLSVLLVTVVIGFPLLTTFTTFDKSPSIEFFLENLVGILPLAPFILIVLMPALAFESWLQYKLNQIDAPKCKKRIYLFAACEMILLLLIVLIVIGVTESNSAVLSS